MVFGNRWEKDILYREEMEGLEKEFRMLNFYLFYQREKRVGKGRSGYVHAIYEEIFADKRPAYFIYADGRICCTKLEAV